MASNSVVTYVEDRAGQSLRAVAEYDPEGYELTYVRDDLARENVSRRVATIHRYVAGGDRSGPDDITETLGDPYASVQLREKAVIVNLVSEDREGVLVGLEPEVCRDLNGFVTECLSRIEGPMPPTPQNR